MGYLALAFLCSTVFCIADTMTFNSTSQYRLQESTVIAEVPSGFPVGFSLLTSENLQYVAFYDKDHNMTVASRELDLDEWTYQILPSKVGWDSHNDITLALDEAGQLHVSGNMHANPLVYFRTEKSGEIQTLRAFPMTGKEGDRVTYPRFLKDHEGRLVFCYRTGGSGRGAMCYNKYDAESGTWSPLLEKPIMDGEGERSAYPLGPVKGPNGYFHVVWVWRDTPDCATNHHLSYARSGDLVHWESAFGEPVELPLVLAEQRLWIDPIPSGGGIINGCQKLFFDDKNRPVVTYHKSDADGNMQIYASRAEAGQWKIHALTDWEESVPFSGMGSIGFIGIWISGLSRVEPGVLMIDYRHKDYGEGQLFLDEESLRPLDRIFKVVPELPQELRKLESDFEGMEIRRKFDLGDSPEQRERYLIQWETLPKNQDLPRQPPLPEPSVLKVHKIEWNRE
jgi:hypothetical protein